MRPRWLIVVILVGTAVVLHLVALRWDLRNGQILGFLAARDGWTLLSAALVGLLGPLVAVTGMLGLPARWSRRSWQGRLSLVLLAGVLPVAVLGTIAAMTGVAPRAVGPFGVVWIIIILLDALFAALPPDRE